MDKKRQTRVTNLSTMTVERRQEVDAARRAAKLSPEAAEEKAMKRQHALSLAAAFKSWSAPRRYS